MGYRHPSANTMWLILSLPLFLVISPSSLKPQLPSPEVPPGLETFHQSVQNLRWRNGGCRSGRYSGEVNLANVPDGLGTFTCSSHTYTGGWREGKREGRGVNSYFNGDVYTGDWESDQRWVQTKFELLKNS